MLRRLSLLPVAFSLVMLAGSPQLVRGETINVGTAYRTGATNNGFPEFLEVAETNASTRAWNLFGTNQTLNGISLVGTVGDGTYSGGLTISGTPLGFAGGPLTWTGDSQASAKSAISNTGLYLSPGSFSVDITATPGSVYQVELLSSMSDNKNPNSRVQDVTVDGTLFADELLTPGNPAAGAFTVVYKFLVTADGNGIDITFSPGASGGTYLDPYINAIGVTLVPEPSTITLAMMSLMGLIRLRRNR